MNSTLQMKIMSALRYLIMERGSGTSGVASRYLCAYFEAIVHIFIYFSLYVLSHLSLKEIKFNNN